MNIEQGILNVEVKENTSTFKIPCSIFPARPVRWGYSNRLLRVNSCHRISLSQRDICLVC